MLLRQDSCRAKPWHVESRSACLSKEVEVGHLGASVEVQSSAEMGTVFWAVMASGSLAAESPAWHMHCHQTLKRHGNSNAIAKIRREQQASNGLNAFMLLQATVHADPSQLLALFHQTKKGSHTTTPHVHVAQTCFSLV